MICTIYLKTYKKIIQEFGLDVYKKKPFNINKLNYRVRRKL